MDGLTILREARDAGLHVSAVGNRLVVKGPRRLEAIAKTLIAQKPSVLEALAGERDIAWRIEAMSRQVTIAGAIRLLLARPGIRFAPGSCCSCGDRLPVDQHRCGPCAAAAVEALAWARECRRPPYSGCRAS